MKGTSTKMLARYISDLFANLEKTELLINWPRLLYNYNSSTICNFRPITRVCKEGVEVLEVRYKMQILQEFGDVDLDY